MFTPRSLVLLVAVLRAMDLGPTLAIGQTEDVDYSDELPRIAPLSPEEAREAIAVADGYRAELTAAEPMVVDPIAMCFDADARLYVIEMRDYSEQDKAQLGRVRLLTDTDADGKFDESVVFADGLSWPTAITPWRGGVFVGAPPHLYYLKDTDGDDRADVKRIVLTGFGRTNVQGMMNSLRWGPDCRIHGATSSSGANLTSPLDPDFGPIVLRGRDFSFDPRSFESKPAKVDVRPESGGAQHGMCFDDWGNKFVCSNSDHLQAILYEDRYAARHPYLKAPPARVRIAADGGQAPVFRRSPVEPWRIVRTRLRVNGTVRGPVEGGGKPAGYFTGATGVTIYRGDLMPDLRGLAFVGDVGSNLVHRKRITPNGTTWIGERIDGNSEFLASTDIWFRPVQMANGPDGALHVLDMAREVIEHPKSLPPEIKMHLDLTSGRDKGRLWRVVPVSHEDERLRSTLSRPHVDVLVATLDSDNGWHVDTASRLLVEADDPPRVAASLRRAATRDRNIEDLLKRTPLARLLRSLHVLQVIGELEPRDLVPHLDRHLQFREQILRLAESFPNDPVLRRVLVENVEHERSRVRLQVALSAGAAPIDLRVQVLTDVLAANGPDPMIRFAAFSSLREGGGRVLSELVKRPEFVARDWSRDVLGDLAELVGRQARADEVAHVVRGASAVEGPLAQEVARRLALGLTAAKSPLASRIGGELGETLQTLLDEARRTAAGEGASSVRLGAIRTLALGRSADDTDLLLSLLDVREPDEVQVAALETLAERDDAEIGDEIVERWPSFPPAVRREALETVLSRDEWRTTFLTAVEDERIQRAEVDVPRLTVLRATVDGEARVRLNAVLSKLAGGTRTDVIAKFRQSLKLDGDAERGRAVFRKTCAACHRLEDHGHAIAPNLATIRNRGDEAILLNVLDPNREVNPAFLNYVVVTKDGRQHVGILADQTATSLTLKRPENKSTTLLRADVEAIKSSGLSMMPEGIEKDVSVEAMADLLAYLRSVR